MKRFLLLALFPAALFAQSRVYEVPVDNSTPRKLQVDQTKLHVDLNFEPAEGKVIGRVIIDLVPTLDKLDSIFFDGPGIIIHNATANNEAVKFKLYDKGVALYPDKKWRLGDSFQVVFNYEAWPKRGIFFVGWDDETHSSPKQIWTQGQGVDNRFWVPHVDDQNDKLITSISATVDADYTVISNGELVDKTPLAGKMKWNYAMREPHSSYLMMLAIGKYESFTEYANGVELQNYFYPDWKDRNELTYFKNVEIFNFLSKEIGVPYPWQNYKQVPVKNFQHGAMENTSATIFGDFLCVDSNSFNDRNYVNVNAHELAHQWFGDWVTAQASKDHWLHEGFATYYAWLVEKEIFGPERFAILGKQYLDQIEAAEQRDMFPLAHGKASSERFYFKGAWVLHMLKKEIGTQAWKELVSNFLNDNKNGIVTTSMFQEAVEKVTGTSMKTFFEQWVYRSQIPELTLEITDEEGIVKVSVSQELLAKQPFFNISFPIKIITNKHTQEALLTMEGPNWVHSFRLPAGEYLVGVIPDANLDLLAKWHVNADIKILENMAAFKKFNWFGAVFGMVNHPEYNSRVALKMADAQILNRLEYAAFLGNRVAAKGELANEEVLFLKYEQNLDVIKAFLFRVNNVQEELFSKLEDWLELPSYDIQEKALQTLCYSDPENAAHYLEVMQGVQGTVGHNLRITWLLLNSAINHDKNPEELVAFSSPVYDFLTRINALAALNNLGVVNDDVARHAFSGVFQGNRRLRGACMNFIKEQNKQKSSKIVFQNWFDEHKEALADDELATVKKLLGM